MKEELIEYGLNEKEAEIYLAALREGSSTANRISELTGIRRSTVYEVVESLKKKGLIGQVRKDKKFYFTASKPTTLVKSIKEKEEKIKKIIPDLEKISNTRIEKSKVESYEGLRGIKAISEEMLFSKEIWIYGSSNIADKILGHYTENFARRRVENKILLKAIIEKDVPQYMKKGNVKKYTKIKTNSFFKSHDCAYFICKDFFLIITLGEELSAIKIINSNLLKSQKKMFEYLWKTSKE